MATESQLTISPLNRLAMASESAVLPLPVGPTITTSRGSVWIGELTGVPVEEASIAKENKGEAEDDHNEDADGFRAQYSVTGLLRGSARNNHRRYCIAWRWRPRT